jgi:hypothetical protein
VITGTPAEVLLDKLGDRFSGDRYKDTSAEAALTLFVEHLDWLKSRHVKKSYQADYLVRTCFQKDPAPSNRAESNAYCRAHLSIAVEMFKLVVENLRAGKISIDVSVVNRADIIRDYIFDVKVIAEYLERQKNPSYQFFIGGKSHHLASFELFALSRQLASQSIVTGSENKLDHRAATVAAVCLLRQALELKFERLCAVNVYHEKKRRPRLKSDFYYVFICENINHFNFKYANFPHVTQVYVWCHNVVHQAFQPLAWQIDFAPVVTEKIFRPKEFEFGKSWSIFQAVEVADLALLRKKFEDYFMQSRKGDDRVGWKFEPFDPEAKVID